MRKSLRQESLEPDAGEYHFQKTLRAAGSPRLSANSNYENDANVNVGVAITSNVRSPRSQSRDEWNFATQQSPPALTRSDSVDSESSFRRRSPRTSNVVNGKYQMRKTLRGARGITDDASIVSDESASIRLGSSRMGMKSTLRNSSASSPGSPASGLRSSLRKDTKSGFRLSSSSKNSKFRSRFEDSSDEEDDELSGLPQFSSRFEDSDDDDESYEPRVMSSGVSINSRSDGKSQKGSNRDSGYGENGVAGTNGAGMLKSVPEVPSSTDIDAVVKPAGNRYLNRKHNEYSTNENNVDLAPPPADKKKRKFFGFGKRRESHSPLAQVHVGPATSQKRDSVQFNSTNTEPSRTAIAAAASSYPNTFSPSSTPAPPPTLRRSSHGSKLQRKAPASRAMSDIWPLPDTNGRLSSPVNTSNLGKMNEIVRPSTADEVYNVDNSSNAESTTYASLPAGRGNRYSIPVDFGRSGKKKRFPMLRKAFGLSR